MPIAPYIKETMNSKSSSVIRKMFEEGNALKEKYGADKVFDFSLGNPDLDPPEEVFKAVEDIAKDRSHNCHGYMPNAGYPATRAAMAEKTSCEQGVKVEASNVCITVGAAGALNCVFKAILSEGDEIVVPSPFFAEYRHYVHNYKGKLIEVPCKEDFSLDVEAIKNALTSKTAAVLINTPNNPTGKIYSEDDIKALAAVLEEHAKASGRKPYLICDEPYRAISYDGRSVASTFPVYDETVIVTSFAKNLSLPGERLGYIAINPKAPDAGEFIAACIFANRILGFVNAPAFFQKVVAKSWNAKVDYSSYEKRRNEIMSVLDAAGLKYAKPEGAFYIFCKVPDAWGDDDMAFCEHLKKFLVICAPGSGFGRKGWFRISYCVSEATILNSKDAFCKAVASK
ncbi:MAG: pyridoxal phosphate-dependent aminotransferase [Treponema sp.]|nr:pyridoxal phosphate-dependent aminotransferase [Treponema sp.]